MTIGPSASGKNLWLDQFLVGHPDWLVLERDVIRFTDIVKNDGVKDWTKYKFNRKNEQKVTEIQNEMLQDAADNGVNVVICETNLNPKNRNNMVKQLESLGYDVEFKDMDVPDFLTLVKRDAQRLGGVGYNVIYKQYQQWLDYKGGYKYRPNDTLPCSVVFDIDGTLARMKGGCGHCRK
jgi:predicted kinase